MEACRAGLKTLFSSRSLGYNTGELKRLCMHLNKQKQTATVIMVWYCSSSPLRWPAPSLPPPQPTHLTPDCLLPCPLATPLTPPQPHPEPEIASSWQVECAWLLLILLLRTAQRRLVVASATVSLPLCWISLTFGASIGRTITLISSNILEYPTKGISPLTESWPSQSKILTSP